MVFVKEQGIATQELYRGCAAFYRTIMKGKGNENLLIILSIK